MNKSDEFRAVSGPLRLEAIQPVNFTNYEIRFRFTNFTGKPIYTKTVHNIPVVIQPEKNLAIPRERYDYLKIEVLYTINDQGSSEETLRLIDAVIANNLHVSDEAMLMREQIKKQLENRRTYDPTSRTIVLSVGRHVMSEKIAEAGIAYIPEANIVATFDKEMISKPHPYSPEGMENIEFSRILENKGQAGIIVKVVDNDQLAPYRFFYAAKRLVRVESVIDHRRESGVYVTTCNAREDRTTEFMSFHDAEERIGLFKSQDEAVTYGDPKLKLELEDSELKVRERELNKELIDAKAQAAKNKQDYENIAAALANANLQRKSQYEAKEYERKDHYEDRSYARKDASEAWKLVPVAIGVVVGVAGFFFGRR